MALSSREAAAWEEMYFAADALQEGPYKHQQLQAKRSLGIQCLHARYHQAYQRHCEDLLGSQGEIGLPRSGIKDHSISCLLLFPTSNINGLSGERYTG